MGDNLIDQIYDLVNIFSNQEFEIYDRIYAVTETILSDFYGENIDIDFPVDIRGMIKKQGIGIAEIDLNLDLGFRMDRINGHLRYSGKEADPQWRIDVEYADSEFVKRYVLAHEFCHFWIKKVDKKPSGARCVDPMLPREKEELLADAMAAYLLFPPKALLKAMKRYRAKMKEKNEYPIDSVTFLRDIGNQAQVSTYHTFLCYQYVRYYLCALYNRRQREDNEEACKWLQEYSVLFK